MVRINAITEGLMADGITHVKFKYLTEPDEWSAVYHPGEDYMDQTGIMEQMIIEVSKPSLSDLNGDGIKNAVDFVDYFKPDYYKDTVACDCPWWIVFN